jgi:hypothetical protein
MDATLALLFTPVVSTYWPWWEHGIGVTVIAEALAFTLVLLPAQLRLLFGINVATPWYALLQLCALALAVSVFPWRAWAIWRIQRRGAHRQQ